MKNDKDEWVISIIKELEKSEFYGKLVVNFFRGDVSVVNKEESIHRPIKGKGEEHARGMETGTRI